MNVLILFVTLLTIIVYLIYLLAHTKLNYWKKKKVPYARPLPFVGNYGKYIFLQEYVGNLVQKLCEKFPGAPYFGAFFGTEPVLIVQSPEVLKHIFTTDFYHFNGREITKYETKEVITQNIFFSGGNRWKIARQNVTSFFSSAKMRNMFYLIEKCCYSFEDTLDRESSINEDVDIKQLSMRYSMDSICSCAFGVEANTLSSPVNNPFHFVAEETLSSSNYRGFTMVFRAVWPAIFYGLGFRVFPKMIDTFFSQMLKGVFQTRNQKPSIRNDFIDLLLSLKNKKIITSDNITNTKTGLDEKIQVKVEDDLLVAQCILFFVGGFETSSTVQSFTLYELAKNPQVQKRAAEEVDEYLRRHGNKLTYDCVKELPYVNACVNESMRMYPAFGNLTREVMDDCVLPDGLRLNKGVRIHIPVYHLHHNPNYFPEPEVYKPERFLAENKENIKPYTFLAFGEGPRICIGKRFALMQVLAGLITFLKKYRVELAENMPETVTFDARTFLIKPRGQGLMVKLYKREGWEQRKLVRTSE